jgi:hypothetical protein
MEVQRLICAKNLELPGHRDKIVPGLHVESYAKQ